MPSLFRQPATKAELESLFYWNKSNMTSELLALQRFEVFLNIGVNLPERKSEIVVLLVILRTSIF